MLVDVIRGTFHQLNQMTVIISQTGIDLRALYKETNVHKMVFIKFRCAHDDFSLKSHCKLTL